MKTALGFLLSLVISIGIPMCLARLRKGQSCLALELPVYVLFHWALLSMFSTLIGKTVGYHLLSCTAAVLIASVTTWWIGGWRTNFPQARAEVPWKKIAIAAFIAMADGFLLFYFNSWGFETGAMPSFRTPFNNDAQRNLVLVNALIRGDGNPFMVGSQLFYQVFWHRWAALFLAPLDSISNYSILAGCNLTTSFLFYGVVFWFFAKWVPWIYERWSRLFVLIALVATHAEIVNAVLSLWRGGPIGLEADWTMRGLVYFRFVSSKLLGLTAPQHLFFLCSFLVALGYASVPVLFLAAAVICFWASPILFVISFGCLLPGALFFLGRKRALISARLSLPFIATGVLGYALLNQVSPLHIFSVGRADELWFLPVLSGLPDRWFTLWISSVGPLSVAILFAARALCDKLRSPLMVIVLGWLVTGLCFNLLVTNAELRRHSGMILVALSLVMLAMSFPRSRFGWSVLRGLALWAVALHGVFLVAFSPLSGPMGFKSDINYGDYFEMNRYLKKNLAGIPVYAASAPELGIIMPIVAEVTTTFVEPLWIGVHGVITNERRALVNQIKGPVDFILKGRSLGYQYVLWGPIEKRIWGDEAFKILSGNGEKMTTTGTVELYRLSPEIEKVSEELLG